MSGEKGETGRGGKVQHMDEMRPRDRRQGREGRERKKGARERSLLEKEMKGEIKVMSSRGRKRQVREGR